MYFPLSILAMENDADRQFMENLYVQYRLPMYRAAMGILKDPYDAEDIINDACIALIRHIDLLRKFGNYRLFAYIMTTTKNLSINLINKRKREKARTFLSDQSFDIADGEPSAENRVIQEGQIDDLMKSLSHLPQTELNILQMKYLNELTNSEIAHELGMTTDMVRAYLSRARKHATVILGREDAR